MRKITTLLSCISLLLACGQSIDSEHISVKEKQKIGVKKINGLSFVASPSAIDSSTISKLFPSNANWISVMPFGYMPNENSPKLVYDVKQQWWGERLEGAKITIELAHDQGLKVMLKPQIWIGSGSFTGNLQMSSESDWTILEQQYSTFILAFAELAQISHAEMLCIGTELETFVKARPTYWIELIETIKSVYSGELTYAENWDCWDKIPFWGQLDYIGVDAYFPISGEKNPTQKQLSAGWEKHLNRLETFSKQNNKPILFTEYGYRSVDYATKEPWNYNTTGKMNEQAQFNALQALYEACWHKDWFAGGFLWKWFPKHENHLGESDTQFSPQGKLAEKLISEWYGKELF